jgi:hypothetical protein
MRKAATPLQLLDGKTCDQAVQPISILATFMQAASTGNINLVKFTLMAGADVSMVAEDGSTALHCAAKTGQIETMRYLFSIGANADTQKDKGRTPLLETVQNRGFEVSRFSYRTKQQFHYACCVISLEMGKSNFSGSHALKEGIFYKPTTSTSFNA